MNLNLRDRSRSRDRDSYSARGGRGDAFRNTLSLIESEAQEGSDIDSGSLDENNLG